ncbi:MAG: DUF47 family protein [Ignavibacteria bacterium]|nr:DUF47 family protein [Ignavibacteria bacterium]
MFKKLMPKEEKYFENFNEMVKHLEDIAKSTHDFFTASSYDPDLYLKLKPIEKRCDEITSKVTKRLNKTFITPFDREDIFNLIKKLDGIGDILVGAVSRVETYNLTKKIEDADKLTAIVVQQLKELGRAIQDLRKGDHFNECEAVKDLETEADHIYRNAMKNLFAKEMDAITLIKKKEILDMLENASDKCQSTANVIISIFIKNS